MGLTKACFATATPSLHKPLLATPKYQNYYITLQHNKKTIYTLFGIIPMKTTVYMRIGFFSLFLSCLIFYAFAGCMNLIDFLNPKYKTSVYILTDGEEVLLHRFSGESETELFVVYFLGRTEKERIYWDVYNKEGFWAGKDIEIAHIYDKKIERYIRKNRNSYYVFSVSIDKKFIEETTDDEFIPNSNAVYKTHLLTDGRGIVVDSFKVQDTPKETAEYLLRVLKTI